MSPILGIMASAISGNLATVGIAGYTGGAGSISNRIEKLLFSTETNSVLSATTTISMYAPGSCSNDGTAGYIAGGAINGDTRYNNIDKLLYSNETKSAIAAASVEGRYKTGTSNSGTAGYFLGGNSPATAWQSQIDKITYSNDARTTISATMSPAGFNINQTMINKNVAGYVSNPYTSSGGTNSIQKLLFSTEVYSTISATNPLTGWGATETSNTSVAGYRWSQYNNAGATHSTSIQKLLFSTETRSTLSNTITARTDAAGMSNATTGGYFCGGYSTGAPVTTIQKLLYGSEVTSVISSTLTNAERDLTGFSNNGSN